jgi:hypothetical protein
MGVGVRGRVSGSSNETKWSGTMIVHQKRDANYYTYGRYTEKLPANKDRRRNKKSSKDCIEQLCVCIV